MPSSLSSILVVDDDKTVLDVVSKGLEDHGYKVHKASGGRGALEIVRTRPIDAVITDMQMPDGNGAVLLKDIKSLPQQNPFVIFMADLSDISLEQAYDMGAEAVFIKPFSIRNLLSHLDLILDVTNKNNKRVSSRLKVGREIQISASELNSGKKIELNDIGIGGFAVSNPENLPQVNDTLPFTIQLSGDLFIIFKGKGIVRWTRPAGQEGGAGSFGVEFSEFDKSNSLKAAELINFLKTKRLITGKQSST